MSAYEDYYRPEGFDDNKADIVILTASSYIEEIKETKRGLISARAIDLRRWPSTWADVLDIGRPQESEHEKIDGLPVIPVSEGYDAMKRFFAFFAEDADVWPKCTECSWDQLVETWELSCKYQTPHVTFACETHWSAIAEQIQPQQALSLYIKAVILNRTDLSKVLRRRAGQGDMLNISSDALKGLPFSCLCDLFKSQIMDQKRRIDDMVDCFSRIRSFAHLSAWADCTVTDEAIAGIKIAQEL